VSGATEFKRQSSKFLDKLSEIEKYEHDFPFYRMRIDQYEGKIKRFVTHDDEG